MTTTLMDLGYGEPVRLMVATCSEPTGGGQDFIQTTANGTGSPIVSPMAYCPKGTLQYSGFLWFTATGYYTQQSNPAGQTQSFNFAPVVDGNIQGTFITLFGKRRVYFDAATWTNATSTLTITNRVGVLGIFPTGANSPLLGTANVTILGGTNVTPGTRNCATHTSPSIFTLGGAGAVFGTDGVTDVSGYIEYIAPESGPLADLGPTDVNARQWTLDMKLYSLVDLDNNSFQQMVVTMSMFNASLGRLIARDTQENTYFIDHNASHNIGFQLGKTNGSGNLADCLIKVRIFNAFLMGGRSGI